MKLGITGADGLLGFHARCCLHALKHTHETRLATRDTFASPAELDEFVRGLDGILHFAGVSRAPEVEVETGNIVLAESLLAALRRTGATPAIAYANSTHFARDNAYGRGKRAAAQLLEQWGAGIGARVGNFILPHVFGESGKPFYNSVVSTFCHQLARGEEPRIDVDSELELLHAQDVAEHFLNWLQEGAAPGGEIRLRGMPMRVSQLLERLRMLLARYAGQGTVPNLDAATDLRLFNTLLSYLYPDLYPRPLELKKDARGELFEAVKADQGGQTFLSNTVPGATRGNHWHLRKIERFLVIGGRGVIRIRKLFTDEVLDFEVNGEVPVYIDIPTLHTHSITNTGEGLLQTLFWSNEIFDPTHPDTYPEPVLL
jgi:UDP-2-acetamido-2,6-beta-L-arabino-hexul-4-ose reductase